MNQEQVIMLDKIWKRFCHLILVVFMVLFCFPEEAISVTQTWQVSAGEDNCWANGIGMISTHNTQLYIGWNNIGGWWYSSGFRFVSVDIPSGSTISSAYLRGCVAWSWDPVNSNIRGQDADNPDTFSTYNDFINRPRTTAQVDWNISSFPSVGEWITSPDIATVIQEIIDRPGWSSGNAMVIFCAGETGVSGVIYFRVYGWDFDPNSAAILEVTYSLVACEEASLPSKNGAASLQVYPNPFSKLTKISFGKGLSAEGTVLKVYDSSGRVVKTFNLSTPYAPRPTHISWGGTNDSGHKLPAGVYFVRLETDKFEATEKVILLR